MADRNGYIGRAPSDSAVTVARQTFTPTGVTTDFTFQSGYTPGYFDLFINGVKMIEGSDFTSSDGSTFSVLGGGASSDDILEAVAYKAFNAVTGIIGVRSEGTVISSNANVINFVGTGNTFALRGDTVDISINAGAAGTWTNYDSNTGVSTTKKVKIESDLEVTGVTTSTGGFVGNVTGTATGLSGTPDITINNLTGVAGTFTGFVAFSTSISVGGTITYEDVQNVDSIGVVTARNGVKTNVSPAITIRDGTTEKGFIGFNGNDPFIGRKNGVGVAFQNNKIRPVDGDDGSASNNTVDIGENTYKFKDGYFAGTLTSGNVSIADSILHTGDTDTAIRFPAADTFTVQTNGAERLRITSGGGFHFTNGELIEQANITAGKLSDNTNIDLENGMVHLFTTAETTTSTPNIRINSSTSLNSEMAVGEVISVTLITTAAAAGYSAQLTIDGNAVTENWTGGSAPDAGGSSGVDIHAYTIIKTADATFTVIATQTTTS